MAAVYWHTFYVGPISAGDVWCGWANGFHSGPTTSFRALATNYVIFSPQLMYRSLDRPKYCMKFRSLVISNQFYQNNFVLVLPLTYTFIAQRNAVKQEHLNKISRYCQHLRSLHDVPVGRWDGSSGAGSRAGDGSATYTVFSGRTPGGSVPVLRPLQIRQDYRPVSSRTHCSGPEIAAVYLIF